MCVCVCVCVCVSEFSAHNENHRPVVSPLQANSKQNPTQEEELCSAGFGEDMLKKYSEFRELGLFADLTLKIEEKSFRVSLLWRYACEHFSCLCFQWCCSIYIREFSGCVILHLRIREPPALSDLGTRDALGCEKDSTNVVCWCEHVLF